MGDPVLGEILRAALLAVEENHGLIDDETLGPKELRSLQNARSARHHILDDNGVELVIVSDH